MMPTGLETALHTELADVNARRAIDVPADAPMLAITGPAASGKTETLARRYVALLAQDASIGIAATIVTASRREGAAALASRIDDLLPAHRVAERAREGRYVGVALDRLAFDILAENATLSGLAYDLEAIDAFDAEELFARAIAPLLSADWSEFLGPEIDPEIPGLRAPDRFALAVLRLIRKLRDAHISPDDFLTMALRGATKFYANPPNLSAPALLFATKDEHRSALSVDANERERQRRRELDLAKIVAKLYRSYLHELVEHGCLTATDAIAEATRLLAERPVLAHTYRERFRLALVDDVHDLHTGEFRLLQAIFGATLVGVTVAGDADAATETFAGVRPERVFGAAASTIALQANYRVPAQSAAVVRAVLEPLNAPPIPNGDAVRVHRAATPEDETTFVAEHVAALVRAGTSPARIAVLHRSARTLAAFEDALVERNIPIALHGDAALFTRHDTLDALGLLWSTVDPFRHAWLLRVLQMPLLRLSDATLALLCGEPASAQALLFDLPPQEDADGSRRWDRRRDLRLGTNVVRGDRDIDLDPEARARLTAFRARRVRWQGFVAEADVAAAARAIVVDGGMYAERPGETAARTRRRIAVVERLLDVIARYAQRARTDDLAGALAYCERIATSETGPIFHADVPDAVVVGSIDRVKARRFDHVFVVDVRAGSFPPYYVPDAFLFSPVYGMIPKDSVGDAVTARTAKFTWYQHHAKLRESFAREDRRALAVAIARADMSVTISASGKPTRGIAAPELLEELQAIKPALVVLPPLARGDALPDSPPVSGPAQSAPVTADVRSCSAERLAAMMDCVRCAPHGVVTAALDGSITLLSGRLPGRDERIEARDIDFAVTLGGVAVFGSVRALIRHDGALYVTLATPDAASAAIAIGALGDRVAGDSFFVETEDGVCSGPHRVAADDLLEVAAAVASGEQTPVCGKHRRP